MSRDEDITRRVRYDEPTAPAAVVVYRPEDKVVFRLGNKDLPAIVLRRVADLDLYDIRVDVLPGAPVWELVAKGRDLRRRVP